MIYFVVDICGKALCPNKVKGCGLNAFSMSVRFRLYPFLHKEVLGMRCSKRKYNIAYGIMLLYYDIGKPMGHKANTSTWCVLETEMRISG